MAALSATNLVHVVNSLLFSGSAAFGLDYAYIAVAFVLMKSQRRWDELSIM